MIEVYGSLFSPFVRKVHVVAAEKGVEVAMMPGGGPAPSADFLAASPFRKIPAMKDGDYTLADSSAIATYLEALHPEPALYPAEPKARGRAVFFDEAADTVLGAAGGKVVFNRVVKPRLMKVPGDEAMIAQGEAELVPLLAWLETQAPEDGWLAGAFSIADIAVASVLTTLGYGGVTPEAALHPRTIAWLGRVRARPAWQRVAAIEAEALKNFV